MSSKRLLLSSRIRHLAAALLIFMVLYSLTNAYSAAIFISYPERIHTLSIALDNDIDFIPAMIVPYSWSLILLVASFFMVRTTDQLTRLTARLIVATLLACLAFYLYPARFSFIRPLTADWTAFGYRFLSVTDKPFNQFPSLHVSYALLLGVSLWKVVKVENAQKIVVLAYHLALSMVCLLIIISIVFTYQHHLLDIIGGAVLAVLVLLIVNKLHSVLVLKYLTVAIAGFLVIAIASFFISAAINSTWFEYIGLAIASYWLASFLVLAWLYQFDTIAANKIWFNKDSRGKLTLATWLSFAPLLLAYKTMSGLGQRYANYQQNKQSGNSSDEKTAPRIACYKINDHLSTVATARLSSARVMQQQTTQPYSLIIIDVAAEIDSHFCLAQDYFIEQNNQSNFAAKTQLINTQKPSIHYLYLPLLDLQPFQDKDSATLLELFRQINSLSVLKNEQSAMATLLNFHCVMGFSRSIVVQVLYLVYCDKLSLANYRQWIDEHYLNAHISKDYLPESVIRIIADS